MNEQTEAATASPDSAVFTDGGSPYQEFFGQGSLDEVVALIQAGGPVVMILIVMSVFALALILLKLWQFQTSGMSERHSSRHAITLYQAGRPREALQVLETAKGPLSRVVALAIRGRLRGDLAEQMVREEVLRYGTSLLEDLRGWFRPLEVIASLAPLLGLFGTVLGMIEAFRQLEQAGNQVNPAILSGGIWAALLTTAAGLAVAIPVVAILNWLERRVERLAHEMEDAVTRVFTQSLTANPEESMVAWRLREGIDDAPAGFRASVAAAGE